MALAVGEERVQTHIDPDLFASGNMLDAAVCLYSKLDVVAVRPPYNPHPLDLLDGERCNLLLLVADQPHGPDATAVREGEVLAVRLQLPARLLVLHAAVIMLEVGGALLAGPVVLAVIVEALDGEPGAVGTGLPGLGVEPAGKRVLFGKVGAQALQVVPAGAAHLHPEPQGLVPDKLDDAHGLLDGDLLRRCPVQFVLIAEHRL